MNDPFSASSVEATSPAAIQHAMQLAVQMLAEPGVAPGSAYAGIASRVAETAFVEVSLLIAAAAAASADSLVWTVRVAQAEWEDDDDFDRIDDTTRETIAYVGPQLDAAVLAANAVLAEADARGLLPETNPYDGVEYFDAVVVAANLQTSWERKRQHVQEAPARAAREAVRQQTAQARLDAMVADVRTLPYWAPPELAGSRPAEFVHMQIEEVEDGIARLLVDEWPRVEADGCLRYPSVYGARTHSRYADVAQYDAYFGVRFEEHETYALRVRDPDALADDGLVDPAQAFEPTAIRVR